MKVIKNLVVLIPLFLVINSISATTEEGKGKAIYSYSNVNVTSKDTPGGIEIDQLTIASGRDGKYHYVHNLNGVKVEGIWEGPLPVTPNVDDMIRDMTKDIKMPHIPELANLSSEIDSTLQGFIKKALSF